METTIMNRFQRQRAARNHGFTLIEALISIVVLTIGLLMALALFTKGLSATQFAQQDMIAKQKAREQLEAIYAARNDNSITWDQIQNVGTGGGIYPTGFRPLYAITNQSSDIMGVTVPAAPAYDFYVSRTSSSGSFSFIPLPPPLWQRQVIIGSTGDPNLRTITVTVQVTTPGLGTRSFSVLGEISRTQ